ncbi:hypothetical protein ACFL1G_05255 [Planctomycetota bacterium]
MIYKRSFVSILVLLAAAGCWANALPNQKIIQFRNAITTEDIETVRNLLKDKPELANEVFERQVKGQAKTLAVSVLSLSLQRKQKDIAELLLLAGADPTKGPPTDYLLK